MTQGDLSSWILAGSYRARARRASLRGRPVVRHAAYLGGNADALAAVSDGSRNVGAVYAYDDWTITPRFTRQLRREVRALRLPRASRRSFSPRASVTVTPTSDDTLQAARRRVAARDLPPAPRSSCRRRAACGCRPSGRSRRLARAAASSPERVDHVEVAAEREWAGDSSPAFARSGSGRRSDRDAVRRPLPGTSAASLGHYYVASAGDFDARGWGVSVSRDVAAGVRASVDYTNVESTWMRPSPDADALALRRACRSCATRRAPPRRDDVGREHGCRSPTRACSSSTRSTRGLRRRRRRRARAGARFDVQLNQALPFLNFTGAQWEMLVAVRSLFRDDCSTRRSTTSCSSSAAQARRRRRDRSVLASKANSRLTRRGQASKGALLTFGLFLSLFLASIWLNERSVVWIAQRHPVDSRT